jgi:hypothetical protein
MLDAIDSALAGNDSPRQAARRAFVDVLAKARGTNRTPDCFARHAATSDARKPDGRRLVEAAYGSSAMAFFDHFFLESQSKLGRQMQKVRRFIKTFRDWRDRSAGRSAP